VGERDCVVGVTGVGEAAWVDCAVGGVLEAVGVASYAGFGAIVGLETGDGVGTGVVVTVGVLGIGLWRTVSGVVVAGRLDGTAVAVLPGKVGLAACCLPPIHPKVPNTSSVQMKKYFLMNILISNPIISS
jgi:hypothetical protein